MSFDVGNILVLAPDPPCTFMSAGRVWGPRLVIFIKLKTHCTFAVAVNPKIQNVYKGVSVVLFLASTTAFVACCPK